MVSPFDTLEVKGVSLDSYTCVVDQHMNFLVFLSNSLDKLIDALGVRDIKLFKVDRSLWMFFLEFLLSLLSKFCVSAGQNEVPALLACEMSGYAKSDALV